MAEGARLESVFRGNSNVGSNPTLSAITAFSELLDASTVARCLAGKIPVAVAGSDDREPARAGWRLSPYCACLKQMLSPSRRYSAEQTSPPQIIISPQ